MTATRGSPARELKLLGGPSRLAAVRPICRRCSSWTSREGGSARKGKEKGRGKGNGWSRPARRAMSDSRNAAKAMLGKYAAASSRHIARWPSRSPRARFNSLILLSSRLLSPPFFQYISFLSITFVFFPSSAPSSASSSRPSVRSVVLDGCYHRRTRVQ